MNLYSHLVPAAMSRQAMLGIPNPEDVDVIGGLQQVKIQLALTLQQVLSGMHWLPTQSTYEFQAYNVVSPQRYAEIFIAGVTPAGVPIGYPDALTNDPPLVINAEALRLPINQAGLQEISVVIANTPQIAMGLAVANSQWALIRPRLVDPGQTQPGPVVPAAPAKKKSKTVPVAVGALLVGGLLVAAAS